MFWQKQKQVLECIFQYLEKAGECITTFQNAMDTVLHKGLNEEFDRLVDKTHQLESQCDDLRRLVEKTLYERALLPESRGDILGLMESLDVVLSKAETALFQIQLQQMVIPPQFIGDFERLVRENVAAYRILKSGVDSLFKRPSAVLEAVVEVDKEESVSDRIERKLIKDIFASSMPGDQKILLKELLLQIGEISDTSENVADRMALIAIKRRI